MVAKNLAGCSVSEASFPALGFPPAASRFSFVSFIEITAISALANTAFKKIKTICSKYHIPFIINDNVAVALAVDSDGIHIGQDDQPVKRVRKIIGPHKIIGVSAHNLKEALAAKEDGADYLGVGAMFNTSTKDDATAVSFTQLHEITTKIGLPVVAIGGINQDNCLLLKGTKIDGIAVVSAIMSAPDIKKQPLN